MASQIDEITIEYSEDGVKLVNQLDKVVLSKGGWTTIIFKYQDWDRPKEAFGPEKYSIRRYQKRNGEFVMRSKFNISSKDQAQKIVGVLNQWISE